MNGMTEGHEYYSSTRSTTYSKYMLCVLVAASFLNYMDRQIIYIVGERVKNDLNISDSQLGFLMGTSFAVFYGVAGIAMGRIADSVSRTKMMALALAFWSGLTMLSGAAMNFAALATARIGIGIGEAAAKPCADPMIVEAFPVRVRATAMSFYFVGIHLGSAASLLMGAYVLQYWSTLCQKLPGNACAFADWRAAFMAVGVPGLVVALLIYRLREPPRVKHSRSTTLLRTILLEMSAAVPPFTLWNIHNIGGWSALVRNLVLAAGICSLSTGLVAMTGDFAQWCAIGLGAYSIITWGQAMKLRDPELFGKTFGYPVFTSVMIAGGLIACVSGSVGAWAAPYALRVLGAQPLAVGLYLGGAAAIGAGVGAVAGGWLTDVWRKHDIRAPIWMCLISMLGGAPFLFLMLQADTLQMFAAGSLIFHLVYALWSGVTGALIQDLMLPRMRGAAAGSLALVMIIISSGFGPYIVGKVSEHTGSLPIGMLSILSVVPIATALLLFAASHLKAEEKTTHAN